MSHQNESEEAKRHRAQIDGNFDLIRFFVLVGMKGFSEDPRWLAKKIGCSVEQALDWTDKLLQAGYWVRGEDGKINSATKYFNMATDTGDFLSFSAQIHTRISDKGPCWFSHATIAMSESNAMEFVRKIRDVAEEFRQKKYGEREGEIMVSYSFVICDALHDPNKS